MQARPYRKGKPFLKQEHWIIQSIGADGHVGSVMGWEGVVFRTYSRAIKAITWIALYGGTYEEYKARA